MFLGDKMTDIIKEFFQKRNATRNNYYAKIVEELGGTYLNNATYRLGEYNVYTSKGYVLPKSNKGKGIPLQVFLKEHYNYDVNWEELNKKMIQAGNNG